MKRFHGHGLIRPIAEAQKKVTAVDFCAVPTPEGSRLSVSAAGAFLLGGLAFGTAAGGQISTVDNGPAFFNPVGNYMSPIRAGTCAAVRTSLVHACLCNQHQHFVITTLTYHYRRPLPASELGRRPATLTSTSRWFSAFLTWLLLDLPKPPRRSSLRRPARAPPSRLPPRRA